jgi:hypothetical protein
VAEIERARRAAAVAEENWRDEVMRVWIDSSETAQVHCE